jgi:hypothetical protein
MYDTRWHSVVRLPYRVWAVGRFCEDTATNFAQDANFKVGLTVR